MGEVTTTVSTVVFESPDKKKNGLVHLVDHRDAVPSRDAELVTSACGLIGMGKVKLRRNHNCGECKDALRRAAQHILDPD